MVTMFIGKFDLDLFNDDFNETKTKALVLINCHSIFFVDRGGNQQTHYQ
jgi:hypothetical protein